MASKTNSYEKILSISIFFFLLVITSQGQINKGRFLLGGSFTGYSASSQNNGYIGTNLQIGKVVNDNSVVGLIGSFSAATTKSVGQKTEINNYSAGIFYRKYKPLATNFYFFGEIDATYQYSKNWLTYFPDVNQNYKTTSNGVAVSFIPEISYSVFKRMQMELTMPNIASLSYTKVKTVAAYMDPATPEKTDNVFSANVNLNSNLLNNFGIGFKFLLGK